MTMTKRPKRCHSTELRIVSTSDVHLYHPRVPDENTIAAIDQIIADDGSASTIDILVIAGDLFDRSVPFGDESVNGIVACLCRLLRFCAKYDITLMVLYGTPRHDRKQSERIQVLIDEIGVEIDYIYASTLSVHYLPKYDINVLMIPDEWRTDPLETLAEAKEAIAARGLTQVDYAIMHGCFKYQLPPIEKVRAKAHIEEEYLALVRRQIFIGHHHLFSEYERIVAQGSLNRLSHNEEGPKGYVVYDALPDGDYRLTFIENEDAWTFKTIHAGDFGAMELVGHVNDLDLRPGSFVRIIAPSTHECSMLFKQISKELYYLRMSLDKPKDDVREAEEIAIVDSDYVTVQLNQHNIAHEIERWLSGRNVDPGLISSCVDSLKYEVNAYERTFTSSGA